MPTDRQLVARFQPHELYHIVEDYDVPKDVLEQTMLECGKNDKFCRSRKLIYAALRGKGYDMVRKNKQPATETTEQSTEVKSENE